MISRTSPQLSWNAAGLLGLLLAPAAVVHANPSDGSYRLVFADEFNGTGLNTSKWAAASPSWTMPNSLSTASSSQVSVANGLLTLNAVRTGSNSWSSGSISSYNKYTFNGGYVEARIQLPSTPGSWPAFWGLYTGWPPEADIMEYPLRANGSNGLPNNQYNTAFHYKNSSGGNSSGAGPVDSGSDMRGEWHTFAMDWTSGSSVKFLLDGVQKSSFNSSSVSQMANMYMILDYAVGGWPGTPSTSQWAIGASDQTKVDWVRVWQKNSGGDAASAWKINGNGSWNTSGNWTNGVPKYGNETATFGRVGLVTTSTVSMPSWSVFGGMTFDGLTSGANAGTTAYTIGSSGTLIQLASTNGPVVQATVNSTTNQTIGSMVELWNSTTFKNDMTGGQTLNLNARVSGNGGMTISGVGATVLSAANIYTGGTTIGTGTGAAVLRAAASNALGTGGVTFDTGGNASTARLELTGNATLPNNISLAGRTNTTVAIQNLAGNNTLSGTITTNSGGSNYILQSDSGTLTLTGSASGATAAGVALQAHSSAGARTFTFQGAGDGVVSGKILNGGGTVSLVKAGAGTWTASGANAFTGSASVSGGKLVLANGSTMSGITVSPGATLGSRGNLTSSGVVNVGGTLDLVDGGLNTATATSTLTLSSSTLNFELGNGVTADKLAATGAASVTGTNTINLALAPGQTITNGSSHTILTAASGLSASSFVVGAKPAAFGFYDFTLATPTSGSLVVTATGKGAPPVAYWTGAGSAAIADATNNWGSGSAVNISNWSTDAAGTVDAQQLPGSVTDVILNASNAAGASTATTRLDSTYIIKGLTVSVPGGGPSAATVNTNGNILLLGADGLTLAVASNASATVNGGGTVVLGASQAWANNSNARTLTVSTTIKGGDTDTTLTLNGTGSAGVTFGGVLADGAAPLSAVFDQAGNTTLTAINTYTGSTTVNSGTVDIASTARVSGNVVLNSGATLRLTGGTNAIVDTADVTVGSGATLDVRGASTGAAKTETINTLSGGGTVTRTNSGLSTLTIAGDADGVFSGSITNGNGTLALMKSGGGTLTLSGPGGYSGGTTLADQGGKLLVAHPTALGTGSVSIGQGGSDPTATLQIAGDIAITGVPTLNLASRDLLTDADSSTATIENVSGNNSISANLNINMTGGTAANIVSTAGMLTLTGNLSSTGLSSSRGFDFAGGGDGLASGVISNGTAQSTFVQKDGDGTWTVSGNNTYTAGTTSNGGTLNITGANNWGAGALTVTDGTTLLTKANTYTGGTVITGDAVGDTGSTATGGRVVMADPNALGTGMVTMSGNATLEVATDGGDRAYDLHVGTNNFVNLVSGLKTGSTGINHTLGALFIGINDTVNVTAAANVTGGSPSITLGAITLSSGFGAGSTTFNPTTATLKLGAVSTSTAGAKTLVLAGTASGNAVTGAISNGTSAVSLVKSGSSTWAVSNANTYTGGNTLIGGTLSVAALANGGAASGIGQSTNAASNLVFAGGTLQFTGTGASTDRLLTLGAPGGTIDGSGAGPVNFAAAGAAVIVIPPTAGTYAIDSTALTVTAGSVNGLVAGQGISGTGIPAGTTITAVDYVTGAVTLSAATTAAGTATALTVTNTPVRTLTLTGTHTASTGPYNTFAGVLANAANGNVVGVTKAGSGTWVLTGANTYTGATTVAGGTLRAGSLAYATLLSSAGGVVLDGTTGKLAFDYGAAATPADSIRTLLTTSATNGYTSGQIRAAAVASGQAIGYLDDGAAVNVRLTLAGDADLDGGVSINDFNNLAAAFGQASGKVWLDGDFDYDGGISINDFNLMAANFGQTVASASDGPNPAALALWDFAVANNDQAGFIAATGVPEPSAMAMLAGATMLGLRRRRHRCRPGGA